MCIRDRVTLDADEPLRKAMSLFLRTGISRMPVVGEDSDDVRGLLYFKDVVERVTADPEGAALPVKAVSYTHLDVYKRQRMP